MRLFRDGSRQDFVKTRPVCPEQSPGPGYPGLKSDPDLWVGPESKMIVSANPPIISAKLKVPNNAN